MVSAPGYDPNQLDAQFETLSADAGAPLLNRAIQGRYQPGLMLQPLLIAGALDQGLIQLDQLAASATQPVPLNGVMVRCQGDQAGASAARPLTWGDTLALACPRPLQELAGEWGVKGVAELLDSYGLNRPPSLPVDTEIPPASPPPENPALAVIGQENLTVSPLQMALAYGTLANHGRLPAVQLVEAIETGSGSWESVQLAGIQGSNQLIGPETARQVWRRMAGEASEAAGNDSPIAEHAVSVLAGPEGTTHNWYAGLAAVDSSSRYVVLVVLEGENNPDAATRIGRQVLEAALEG
jgi:peptidoglycan glycosyltransferase